MENKFKYWKNAHFIKTATLPIFYFAPEEFQCTAKGTFILNDPRDRSPR